MTKHFIREKTLVALKEVPLNVREKYEKQLLNHLINKIKKESIQTIGFYYGFYPEINTKDYFDTLWREGVRIYLPRIQPKRQLSFHLYQPKDPLDSAFNGQVYQPRPDSSSINPNELDQLIVPGVAFRLDGHRIGHGGGYYDRLLASLSTKTVSLVFSEQMYAIDEWVAQDHDYPIDELLIAKK